MKAKDIIRSKRFQSGRRIPHHKDVSVARHALAAAQIGAKMCDKLKKVGIQVSKEDVIDTCLLHDIGMTEEKVFKSPSFIKAYTHPEEGARIAKEEYGANEVQCDAIRRHMWPICIVPPKHPEGWLVIGADKLAAWREVISHFRKH